MDEKTSQRAFARLSVPDPSMPRWSAPRMTVSTRFRAAVGSRHLSLSTWTVAQAVSTRFRAAVGSRLYKPLGKKEMQTSLNALSRGCRFPTIGMLGFVNGTSVSLNALSRGCRFPTGQAQIEVLLEQSSQRAFARLSVPDADRSWLHISSNHVSTRFRAAVGSRLSENR